jgi:hypothetical protein
VNPLRWLKHRLHPDTRVYWAGPICMEGKPTTDGRMLAAGALRWQVPVRLLHRSSSGGMQQVGVITAIARDGDGTVRACGYVEAGALHRHTAWVAIDCRPIEAHTAQLAGGREQLVITSAHLIAVVLHTQPQAFPAAQIREHT